MATSRLLRTVAALLLATAAAAHAADADFVADPAIAQAAEASAADAVKLAREQFNLALDGSEASLAQVEHALEQLHTSYALASPKPPDEQLVPVARAFGAYLGEVYRRNHGATWGTVTLNGHAYPGFRTAGGVNVWPAGRVMNVITDGPENDITDVYARLAAGPSHD